MKKFPPGFYFGAATSSHQVEGNCINDWSIWERKNSQRLASEYTAKASETSVSFFAEGADPANYISGIAADHYNRYEEDLTLAQTIGLNAYRFSIEWSRIEPEEGKWNQEGIEHYIQFISALKQRKIEPFVTIWHWPLPLWLSDAGGVMHPHFEFLFARYTSKLAEAFGNDVKFYITINEPEIYSLNGYLLGKWPPQKKGIISYFRAMKVMINSHRAAYREIKKRNPAASIGPACNMTYFESGGGFINSITCRLADYFWNRYFIEKIKPDLDFIGLNYYFHNRIRYGLNRNLNEKISDMGWELYPSGIRYILEKLNAYNFPVYITENGLADEADIQRPWLIEETLKEIYIAIHNRADVRGYFHWSLLDNFEWDKGFWPKFGLISVDRRTMKRTLRASAETYKNIIKRGLNI